MFIEGQFAVNINCRFVVCRFFQVTCKMIVYTCRLFNCKLPLVFGWGPLLHTSNSYLSGDRNANQHSLCTKLIGDIIFLLTFVAVTYYSVEQH